MCSCCCCCCYFVLAGVRVQRGQSHIYFSLLGTKRSSTFVHPSPTRPSCETFVHVRPPGPGDTSHRRNNRNNKHQTLKPHTPPPRERPKSNTQTPPGPATNFPDPFQNSQRHHTSFAGAAGGSESARMDLEPKWPTTCRRMHHPSSSSSSLSSSHLPHPPLPPHPSQLTYSAVPLSLTMPLRSQVPSEALQVQRTGCGGGDVRPRLGDQWDGMFMYVCVYFPVLAGNGQISITRSRVTKRSSTFVNPT